jgi:hypothetical protein
VVYPGLLKETFVELYVQSCGIAPDHDYFWVKVTEAGQQSDYPSTVDTFQGTELLYREGFSLLLGRYAAQLVLLVTGLPTRERSDYQGRKIRNALACVATDAEEDNVRGIALAALQGRLSALLDESVSSDMDSEWGYHVDTLLLEQLSGLVVFSRNQSSDQCFIRKDDAHAREDLIADLQTYTLPPQTGPLVVVTRFKPAEVLKKYRVWRGLSDMVEQKVVYSCFEPTKFPPPPPPASVPRSTFVPSANQETVSRSPLPKYLLVLGIILIAGLVVFVVVLGGSGL